MLLLSEIKAIFLPGVDHRSNLPNELTFYIGKSIYRQTCDYLSLIRKVDTSFFKIYIETVKLHYFIQSFTCNGYTVLIK